MRILVSGLKPHHRLDYPAIVRDLLAKIPPEHLAGIAGITISGDKPLDDDESVLGQYYERWEREPAVIVLYLESMAREAPRWAQRFAITWKILIAETLFHEVAHHYQRFSHGIGGTRQEDHAEAYGQREARRAFPFWYGIIDGFDRFAVHWNRVVLAWLEFEVRMFPLARTHHEIGRRAWNDDDWDKVIRHWEEALRLDPGATSLAPLLREARWQRAREDRRRQLIQARGLVPARRRLRPTRGRAGKRKGGRKKPGRRR